MSERNIRKLIESGEFNEAQTFLSSPSTNLSKSLEYSYRSVILENLEENAASYDNAMKALQFAKNDIEELAGLSSIINSGYRLGKYEIIEKYREKFHQRYRKFGDKTIDVKYWGEIGFMALGRYYHIKGDLDLANQFYDKTADLNKELNHNRSFCDSLLSLGEVEIDRRNLDAALTYFQTTIKQASSHDYPLLLAYANYNIAKIHRLRGNLREALTKFETALNQFDQLKRDSGLVITHNDIGHLHLQFGNMEKSRSHFQKALEVANSMKSDFYRAETIHNLGLLDFHEENIKSGIEKLKESISIWTDVGNYSEVGQSIYQLLVNLIETERDELVVSYLTQLEEIKEKVNTSQMEIRYKLAKANYLKSGGRIKQKVKAQNIVDELLNYSEIIDIEFRITALLLAIELGLFELKTLNNEVILNEISSYVEELQHISEENDLLPLMLEVMILKSKIAIINKNYEEADQLLNLALHKAKNQNIPFLVNKINILLNELREELMQIDRMIEENISLKERIDNTKIMDYLKEVAKRVNSEKSNMS